MLPLAPGRLSITNCCFSAWPSAWPSSRAYRSVPPPGDEGTMNFTGRDGHDSCPAAGATSSARAATAGTKIMLIAFLSCLELPADFPVERITSAAADDVGDARQSQQQGEFIAARSPEKAVFKLDAKGDNRHLDGQRKRHWAGEKPEREQDHAEEFEAPYRPSPEERRFHPELQNVTGGDAVHAALEYLFVTRRNDDHRKYHAREGVSEGREPPVQPGEPRDYKPALVDCTCLVDHGFLLDSEFLPDRAIERIMSATAEQKREAQTQKEKRVLDTAAVPQPAFVDVHAENKNKQLDYEEQRDRTRQEPENKQRAAEKFEHADAVGPRKRCGPSGERLAAESRGAAEKKLLRAVRDENRARAYAQERVAVRRKRLIDPRKVRENGPGRAGVCAHL